MYLQIVKNNNTYYSANMPDTLTYFYSAEKIKTGLNNFAGG
jgi:hypothetical protein